jgi:hypothetical protein
MTLLRWLLFVEAASLVVAAALHSGLILPGPPDDAAMYEASIAIVVGIGLVVGVVWPRWTRVAALAVQAIALVGAFIGTYATLRGFGPRSPLDIVYHVALITLIVIGLAVAWRTPAEAPEATA